MKNFTKRNLGGEALRYSQELGWSIFPDYGVRILTADEVDAWKQNHPSEHVPALVCRCTQSLSCSSPGKHPIGQLARHGANSATTDKRAIQRWWSQEPKANVGILTGQRSGLWILDIDFKTGGLRSLLALMRRLGGPAKESSDAEQDCLAICMAAAEFFGTVVARTGGGGLHIYFRWESALHNKTCANCFAAFDLPGIDIRSDGGHVVAPPSRHVSGRAYTWLREPWSLPVWSPLAYSHLATAQDRPEGPLKLAPRGLIEMITDPTCGRSASALVGGAGTGGNYELAEVIPQGQRNAELTRYAGLLRARGYEQAAILRGLEAANGHCSPPLPQAELKQIAKSIAHKPKGALLETPPSIGEIVAAEEIARRRAASGPEPLGHLKPLDEVVSLPGNPIQVPGSDPIYKENEKPQPQSAPDAVPAKTTWRFCSVTELLAQPDEEVSYLVEDLLGMGEFSALVGKSGHGKSTFVRALIQAVASGEPFIGKTTHRTGPILLLALEDHEQQLKRKMRLQDWGPAGDQVLVHVGAVPEEAISSLPDEIRRLGACFVVVDTLFTFLRAAESSEYAYMNNILIPLRDVARDTGAHVLVIHHARKGEMSEDSTLGSVAITGAMDAVLYLYKSPDGARILSVTKTRYGAEMSPVELLFEPDKQRLTLGAPRAHQKEVLLEDKILDVLRCGDTLTEAELKKGIRDNGMSRSLRRLVDCGKIHRSGSGKKNAPYQYRLAEDVELPFSDRNDEERLKTEDARG